AWGADVPLLPAPDWATATQPVTSSGELPVELRESLSSLSSWLASIPADGSATKKLYEVDSLALLASAAPIAGGGESPMGAMLTARFQAQPFTEPLTRHNYVRARWYDPETGTWLSPDPMGYRDSSNLYAFAGGDPVNGRDPRGLGSYWIERSQEIVTELCAKHYAEWDGRRIDLLHELKTLLENKPETDPNAPKRPGLFARGFHALFGTDWGNEGQKRYSEALDRKYRSGYQLSDDPDIAEAQGVATRDRDPGRALQDATYRDVGGVGVNAAGKIAQGEVQSGAVRVGAGIFGVIARTAEEEQFLRNAAATFGDSSVFSKAKRFEGEMIIQRSDIAWSVENVRLMAGGNAPFAKNAAGEWERINLHHVGRQEAKLIELLKSENRYNPATGGPLHIPGPGGPRRSRNFNVGYWNDRLRDAIDAGEIPQDVLRAAGVR
ncbi:MAG: RHS repeat-associated core domain-containing protein, partial [Thermoanaerobaculia bacterium]